ncbi:MAG: exonuclease subunit SbcD [Actinomycetota bacterium]|nr:exonuclease subunit SbcD [Actinomycetota bacterium]
MRLLHTSDWHLGRMLHGVDLRDAQRSVLDQIVHLVDEHEVDAVVVAGDVYDRAVPPVDAVRLLADVLTRLVARAPVVLLAGNHDSADRLGFGAALFRDGLHVRTAAATVGEPVELGDEHGPVLVYPVPFLDPDVVRSSLSDGDGPLPRSHEAVLGAAMDRVRADLERRRSTGPVRSIVAAHAFVVGRGEVERSDSERDIRVGGVDTAPASVFAGVDYVALGHLHGAQEPASPDGRTRLRYAGSPLRYSFSEATQDKSVTIVDLGPNGVTAVSAVPVEQPRGMSVLSAEMADLLTSPRFAAAEDHWVQVSVTDSARPPDMQPRIRERFPHALVARHTPASGPLVGRVTTAPNAAADPVEVAESFVRFVTGGDATAPELDAFRNAFEQVRRAERAG